MQKKSSRNRPDARRHGMSRYEAKARRSRYVPAGPRCNTNRSGISPKGVRRVAQN